MYYFNLKVHQNTLLELTSRDSLSELYSASRDVLARFIGYIGRGGKRRREKEREEKEG